MKSKRKKVICKLCEFEVNLDNLGLHMRTRHNWHYENNSKEYYDLFIKKETNGHCLFCGEKTKFINMSIGYNTYCSRKCVGLSNERNDKRRETKKLLYGDENYSNRIKFKKTIKNINGFVTCVKKSKETKLKLYGDSSYNNRDKYRETCQNKFGVSCNLALDSMRNPCGISKISTEFFYKLYNLLSDKLKKEILFYDLNKELLINYNNRSYLYDFTVQSYKFVIEFNGDVYHANPSKFNEDDTPHPYNKNLTSRDLWDKDKIKLDVLKKNNYKYIIIWENDYRKNKERVVRNTLSIINNLSNSNSENTNRFITREML